MGCNSHGWYTCRGVANVVAEHVSGGPVQFVNRTEGAGAPSGSSSLLLLDLLKAGHSPSPPGAGAGTPGQAGCLAGRT